MIAAALDSDGLLGPGEARAGAGGRGRTDTLSPEPDFESGASANSATPACGPTL